MARRWKDVSCTSTTSHLACNEPCAVPLRMRLHDDHDPEVPIDAKAGVVGRFTCL